jgi:NADH-quinone oxidoreductase subunit G
VIILGEDVTNTAPRLALALRQAVRNQPLQRAIQKKIDPWNDVALREIIQEEKGPLYIATPAPTPLDDAATSTIHLAPEDIARLGFALAHEFDASAPEVSDLPDELKPLINEIVAKLKDAKKPLIVSGTSLGSEAVIQAAANLAWALKAVNNEARLLLTVPECNSLGLALLDHKELEGARGALERNPDSVFVILENDLYRRADSKFVDELLDSAQNLIMIDSLENATTARADVALPAATFAEGDGTLISNEGRAQRYFQVFVPSGEILESWRWINELMRLRNHEFANKWNNLDDILHDLTTHDPLFAPILEAAPLEDFRIVGQKIPRQPHRYSGRTAMHAGVSVHEPKPPEDPDAPLKFSMEGYKGLPPASLIPRFWAPGWNSVQSLNKFQAEVGGPLIGGDPGRRLIEPKSDARTSYYREVPKAFAPQDDQYLALPLYHIFGSEELSRQSPPVAERIPEAYAVMTPELAQTLGAAEGQEIQVTSEGRSLRLPLRLNASLPANVVGLPAGFPGIPMTLPAWVKLEAGAAEKGA